MKTLSASLSDTKRKRDKMANRAKRAKVNILGVSFDKLTMRQYQQEFLDRIDRREPTMIVTANPEIVMTAKDDADYREIINDVADYVTADGIGVVKAAKMLDKEIPERVAGYDLFTWFMKLADQKRLRVYLIGAKPAVIQAVQAKVKQNYPGIKLVGAEDGYSKDSLDLIAGRIKQTKPDMVFAALGFPKQEKMLAILRREQVPAILMGVGGSFDVFSGMSKRAPKLFIDAHLEWLYRLLREPTRLGRMMILPKFVQEVKRSKRKQK